MSHVQCKQHFLHVGTMTHACSLLLKHITTGFFLIYVCNLANLLHVIAIKAWPVRLMEKLEVTKPWSFLWTLYSAVLAFTLTVEPDVLMVETKSTKFLSFQFLPEKLTQQAKCTVLVPGAPITRQTLGYWYSSREGGTSFLPRIKGTWYLWLFVSLELKKMIAR